jgi:hypothetical protein
MAVTQTVQFNGPEGETLRVEIYDEYTETLVAFGEATERDYGGKYYIEFTDLPAGDYDFRAERVADGRGIVLGKLRLDSVTRTYDVQGSLADEDTTATTVTPTPFTDPGQEFEIIGDERRSTLSIYIYDDIGDLFTIESEYSIEVQISYGMTRMFSVRSGENSLNGSQVTKANPAVFLFEGADNDLSAGVYDLSVTVLDGSDNVLVTRLFGLTVLTTANVFEDSSSSSSESSSST